MTIDNWGTIEWSISLIGTILIAITIYYGLSFEKEDAGT